MEFLIQHNLMNEQQLAITKAAVAPYPHQFIGMIPFSHEITSERPLVGNDYIPYGSTLFTTVASEQYPSWKGLFFDLDVFNYEASVANRDDMLNDLYIFNAECVLDFMTNQLRGGAQDWFVRPSEDLKQFAGQVMEAKECAAWLKDAMACESSGSYKIDPKTRIVISHPKQIKAEWRWFIVGGKIVSGSMYRAHGQMHQKRATDQDVIDEAQSFADKWLPSPCCVMDLALVGPFDEVKVIEFNCIHSSGFYDNDVSAIFKALYEYCIK